MKIAFDENIPIAMVRVFQTLAKEGTIPGVEVVSARTYKPPDERGDEGWVRRFANDGGQVIISGDPKMRGNVHERQALSDVGLITFFFEGRWSTQGPFVKCAFVLKWWTFIIDKAGEAPRGSCWELPFQWNTTEMKDVSRLPTPLAEAAGA